MSAGQQPARVARYNRAVILDLIRRLGPVSKTELAERSGLAVSSILNVLASLSRRGLVRTVGLGPSTGGRPPALVELNPDARYAVGVTVRIASVEAVLLDLVGDVRAETVLPLGKSLEVDSVAATVVEAVDQVIRLAHVDPARVLGAGVACPGPVSDGRTVVSAPSLPNWKRIELADALELRLGLPITLENDANLGALAEYRKGVGGHGLHSDPLVYIYVDHGIGAGVVLDGKLYRGTDGLAGEVGHTVIDVDGPPCVCGSYGCLESLASVSSILRRVTVASRLGDSTILPELVGDDWDSLDYGLVMEAARRGDDVAKRSVDEAISYLAVGISNVMRQFRPKMVAVGGQLFDESDDAFERLQVALQRRPHFFEIPPTQVVRGELGPRAVSVGGATLILEQFFGVAHQVIASEPRTQTQEPAFDQALVWPSTAEDGILRTPSTAKIRWAGNLQPVSLRVRTGESFAVTVDVRVDGKEAEDYDSVKAVLHWDRVHLFGGNWPNPKNSPMHLQRRDKDTATYGLTLGSLPPGKYEFTAHVLGANDLWVRADAPTEVNGRVEVLPNRASSSRKREDIPTEPEAGAGDSVPKMAEREGVSGRASSRAHPS